MRQANTYFIVCPDGGPLPDKNFAKGKLQIRGHPQSSLLTLVPQKFPTERIRNVYRTKNTCFATKGALGGQNLQSST